MLYFFGDASHPVEFVSCGNLHNSNGFVHPRRVIDTFVFLLVFRGTLYITQGANPFTVHENEFMLLFPNTLHYGYRPSEGEVSYYWVHFYVHDPSYSIYNRGTLMRDQNFVSQSPDVPLPPPSGHYLIPEHGKLSIERRSHLLFSQLLDFSKREKYIATWRCHYALSLLLLEITHESFEPSQFLDSQIPAVIFDVMEYIRTHYTQQVTVASIAALFGYHPTYLSAIFKKYTGLPILSYLNRTRVSVAKNLLLNRQLSLSRIADMCGFTDEKYFMKLFKKLEGITPTQYRKAFHQKRINLT